jgi:hypothetical protein
MGWEGVDTGRHVRWGKEEGQRRAASVQWAERIMRKIDGVFPK